MTGPRQAQAGYTLLEMLLTMALIGSLAALIAPTMLSRLHQMKIDRAVNDLRALALEITAYERLGEELPESLEDLGRPIPFDPWGNQYVYLSRTDPNWAGESRKDRFLVPLNQDYDLYSSGPDGRSQPPLTAAASRDDILRAADGRFFGPADHF